MRDGVRAGVPPDAAETWEDGGRWKGEEEGGVKRGTEGAHSVSHVGFYYCFFIFFPVGV